jgi:hypothetical protein
MLYNVLLKMLDVSPENLEIILQGPKPRKCKGAVADDHPELKDAPSPSYPLQRSDSGYLFEEALYGVVLTAERSAAPSSYVIRSLFGSYLLADNSTLPSSSFPAVLWKLHHEIKERSWLSSLFAHFFTGNEDQRALFCADPDDNRFRCNKTLIASVQEATAQHDASAARSSLQQELAGALQPVEQQEEEAEEEQQTSACRRPVRRASLQTGSQWSCTGKLGPLPSASTLAAEDQAAREALGRHGGRPPPTCGLKRREAPSTGVSHDHAALSSDED